MRYICCFLFLILSCSNKETNCDQLQKGVFNLYENDELIGKLYRKNNIQVEKYLNEQSYTIGKFEYIDNCKLYLTHYYVKEPVDTITWVLSYSPLSKNTFRINAKPAYVDTLNYTYVAKIIKTSEKFPSEIDDLIGKLKID